MKSRLTDTVKIRLLVNYYDLMMTFYLLYCSYRTGIMTLNINFRSFCCIQEIKGLDSKNLRICFDENKRNLFNVGDFLCLKVILVTRASK